MPADTTGLYWIATPNCMLRNERGTQLEPEPLKQYMHVRVLERHTQPKFTGAKIATVAGEEIGWVSFPHLVELKRPARPSTAAKQMAAVLAAASAVAGNRPHGACYNNVKHHILNAGGYGDILDIYNDERFIGCQVPAVSFAEAVERAGAAAVGLQRVSGLPKDAEPGTLLILRGNGKAKLDMVNGDISVVASHEKGVVRCYNDGTMTLMADEKHWGAGGHMEGSLVAMYKPIDRT